jgi:hypothetical protein
MHPTSQGQRHDRRGQAAGGLKEEEAAAAEEAEQQKQVKQERQRRSTFPLWVSTLGQDSRASQFGGRSDAI